MTPIVFSKGVIRRCTKDEVAYLEQSVRELADEKEKLNPMFFPWLPSEEEKVKYKDCQIEVTFLPIHPNRLDRLVMILPLFVKDDNRNIWYVQMKDEFGKIELDIQTPLQEGHHRVPPQKR